jgi:long-chain acyl-CoA synthetase
MLSHGNIASNVVAALEVLRYQSTDRCPPSSPAIFERMGGFYRRWRRRLDRHAELRHRRATHRGAADQVVGVPRFYEKVYARVTEAAHAPGAAQAPFFWGPRAAAAARRTTRGAPLAPVRSRRGSPTGWCLRRARPPGGRLCRVRSAPPDRRDGFATPSASDRRGLAHRISPVICLNPFDREKPGTVGPPIPGVEVRIGAEGEILTRGPHVMQGYYRNEAATRDAIRDGWFHTGDIGHLDPDGFLVITDRLKDLLVLAAGKKVAPQPLEAKLKLSPWVGEAVLLGDRRPYVVCLIVPNFVSLEAEAKTRDWAHVSRRELIERDPVRQLYQAEIDRLNADLAPFEQIKRFALIDRELSQECGELTPTLKLKRRVIAENFTAAIETLYAGHTAPAGA